MDYSGTIDYLYSLQRHGIKLGLDNPREILRRFGNPQDAFRSMHVAGTNGKGSTAAMLCSLLKASGKRTGLFTSPHLVSFNERISVDFEHISAEDVISLAKEVREMAEGLNPTFFEVVTVMGFLYFARRGVEYAVIETGLGGRLDATNVLAPEACIITPIGMDHMEFLGNTLADMAAEKAGIIKPHRPVVCAPQKTEAMAVIEIRASELHAQLHRYGRDFETLITGHAPAGITIDYRGEADYEGLSIPLRGDYQALNAALALCAHELLEGVEHSAAIARAAFDTLRWPGRLEEVEPGLYMDGAHNAEAARTLAAELAARPCGGNGLTLVLGVMSDKDVTEIMRPLLRIADEVILTAPAYGRAARPEALLAAARALGCGSRISTAMSVRDALSAARQTGRTVLVTGSFYTIGEALSSLGRDGFLGRLRECVRPEPASS